MTQAAATASTNIANTFSLGPVKIQVLDVSVISGDTTCLATANRMSTVYWGLMTGVTQTSAPTYSTNTATFTFTDPAATVKGQIILLGV